MTMSVGEKDGMRAGVVVVDMKRAKKATMKAASKMFDGEDMEESMQSSMDFINSIPDKVTLEITCDGGNPVHKMLLPNSSTCQVLPTAESTENATESMNPQFTVQSLYNDTTDQNRDFFDGLICQDLSPMEVFEQVCKNWTGDDTKVGSDCDLLMASNELNGGQTQLNVTDISSTIKVGKGGVCQGLCREGIPKEVSRKERATLNVVIPLDLNSIVQNLKEEGIPYDEDAVNQMIDDEGENPVMTMTFNSTMSSQYSIGKVKQLSDEAAAEALSVC